MILEGNLSLFPGDNQYGRYGKKFGKVVKEMKNDLLALRFHPDDIGTNSFCKGVVTLVASGCTVSPPISSLCIRTGWVMGGVKDKYIQRESTGDHYVGCCESCLD